MEEKKNRKMKVYAQSGYNYKEVPTIILKGEWLRDCGFDSGEEIVVSVELERLVIRKR